MSYQVLAYKFKETGTLYKRLIVEPQNIEEAVLENGLITPEQESPLCEIGLVIAADPESTIKAGDTVFYNKIDRTNAEHLDTIEIDGKVCDVIYENEVWSCNDEPIGRIFVELLSDLEANAEGLFIPESVKSVTQKGRVLKAPADCLVKPGDLVEFRKQEQGIFAEALIDDKWCMVLYEADVFKVNGMVAPYRVIVKIDMVAQAIKQRVSETGVHLSELFKFMLYNLQYGVVSEIGSEAAKMYPELIAGDTVILHHIIESQPYRLVGREYSKHKQDNGADAITYEYRAINCWDSKDGSREIMGKLSYEKRTNKIIDIKPYNDCVFLKWEFNMFTQTSNPSPLLQHVNNDISKHHNIDDFRNIIKHNKSEAAEKAKAKTMGVKQVLNNIDPELDKDMYDFHESELRTIQAEETRVANYLRRNHLLLCKRAYPFVIPSYVITTYEELYPINILGTKFLVAHNQFIIAQTTKNMDISAQDILPLGEYAIVRPIIEEEKEGELLVPITAKEKPQKGTIIAISDHPKAKSGDTVLFRKNTGIEQDIEGVSHLFLTHNDLLAVIPNKD